jgi:hypothetical protein
MARKLQVGKTHTFKIIEDGEVIGTLRVKASNLLWKPKNAKGHKSWYGVTPERFGKFAKKRGKRFDK